MVEFLHDWPAARIWVGYRLDVDLIGALRTQFRSGTVVEADKFVIYSCAVLLSTEAAPWYQENAPGRE